jgi:hypothetical protein
LALCTRISEASVFHVVRHAVIAEIFGRVQAATRIERAHLEPRLTEAFNRHASTRTRANDYYVVYLICHVPISPRFDGATT